MLQIVIVGVGITMDIMLYIIAALVLILLVAVMVMRKNKAQKPINTGENAANAPVSTLDADRSSTDQRDTNNVNKFDSLTVAQRFMDQQRYDKAIETLNRALIEKPHDSQLSLKLLSVYATIDQSDDFHKVYDAIKTNGDTAAIKQADELKALLVEEHDQAMSRVAPVVDVDSADFESIDFDLSTTQTNNENTTTENSTSQETPVPIEPLDDLNDIRATDDNVDNMFDLALSDLENTDYSEADTVEPIATEFAPVNHLDTIGEELNLDITGTDTSSATDDEYLATPVNNDFETIENTDDSDFTLDFDLTEQAVAAPVDTAESSALEDISLDDNDFVLDFEDLVTDTDSSIDISADTDVENTTVTDVPAQLTENDFALSLDDSEVSETETKSLMDTPVVIEDTYSENTYNEDTSIAPTTSPTFDDTTFIDDDFELDFEDTASSPTAATPVEVEEVNLANTDITNDITSDIGIDIESDIENANDLVNTETAADFASRFAADFDFVKTLDSHQVTLDLASQYLKLGEYDSAKRLLNEVMAQGNSEQQHQAQALLHRTA